MLSSVKGHTMVKHEGYLDVQKNMIFNWCATRDYWKFVGKETWYEKNPSQLSADIKVILMTNHKGSLQG